MRADVDAADREKDCEVNSITKDGTSHPFATVADFLALPTVAKYLNDPQFQHWAYDGLTIYAVDSRPVAHLVGIVQERVILPRTLHGRKGLNHVD